MENTTDKKSTVTLLYRANSLLTLFFDTVTTISSAFSTINEQGPVNHAYRWRWPLLTVEVTTVNVSTAKHTTYYHTVLTSTVWSPEKFSRHLWMPLNSLFSTEEFSDTPWLHMHPRVRCYFIRLPSVAQQQNWKSWERCKCVRKSK